MASLEESPFYDYWSRTETDSWGTSDSLHAWTVHGDATNFSVDGEHGVISTSTINADRYALVDASDDEHVDLRVTFFVDTAPVGAAYKVALMGRWIDASTYVSGYALLNPGGSITVALEKNGTTIVSVSSAGDIWTVGASMTLRLRVIGNTGYVKIWAAGDDEPVNWHLTTQNFTSGVAGKSGVLIKLGSGSTGVLPATFMIDEAVFTAIVPSDQVLDTFTRSSGNDALALSTGGVWTYTSDAAYGSSSAYQMSPTGTTNFSYLEWTPGASTLPTTYIRTTFKTTSNTASHYIAFIVHGGGGVNALGLQIHTTGQLRATNGSGTVKWTSTTVIAVNTFYRVEALSDSTGSKLCQVRIYNAAGTLLEDSGTFANSDLSGNVSAWRFGYVRQSEPTVIHDNLAVAVGGWPGSMYSNHTQLFKKNNAENGYAAGTAITADNTASVTTGWDISDSNHDWVIKSGSADDFITTGSAGVIAIAKSDGTDHLIEASPEEWANARIKFNVSPFQLTSGSDPFEVGGYYRYADASNYGRVILRFLSTGQIDMKIQDIVAGVVTDIDTQTSAMAYTAGNSYGLTIEVTGENVRARVYPAGSESSTWTVTAVTTLAEEHLPLGIYAHKTSAFAFESNVAYFDDVLIVTLSPLIQVTYVPDEHSPGFNLVILNADNYHRVRVTRVTESLAFGEEGVRGLDGVAITAETVTANDYEAPLDEPFVYRLVTLNEAGRVTSSILSEPQEIDVPYHYSLIRSVSQPTFSRRVQIVSFPEWDQEMRVLTSARVLGAGKSTILYDVLGGKRGKMQVIMPVNTSASFVGYEIRKLLAEGHPLLFQSVGRNSGIEDFYFVATDLSVTRKTTVRDADPLYTYTITFEEITRPPTDQETVGFYTWQSLLDAEHTDWESVFNSFDTWLDVANYTNRDPV